MASRPTRNSSRRPAIPAICLTPPDTRALTGGLYTAKLLFEWYIVVDGTAGLRRLCEERMVLIQEANAFAALREARRLGRGAQYRSKNSDGSPVHFRFVGVLDLLHLGVECSPNEVWYDIVERLRPMERRNTLLPPEEQLSAIREEIALGGGPRKKRGAR
jgi:hypothetical protein